MKITSIRYGMLRVPLKTPFKTALRTVDKVEDIIVSVHTDTGHVGYGEAPATAVITGDTHGSIIEAIQKFIAPRLIGEDIANLNRVTQIIQGALEKNSSAKAAVARARRVSDRKSRRRSRGDSPEGRSRRAAQSRHRASRGHRPRDRGCSTRRARAARQGAISGR